MIDCGHYLCHSCFSEYLNNSIQAGQDSIYTTCPWQKCRIIVPDQLFNSLCTPENYKKYQYYFKKSYIDLSKQTKWCPAPHCTLAVEYPSLKATDVTCKCLNDFCFKCLKKAHKPIHCDVLASWYDRI